MTLASRFATDDGARSESLNRARECAALTFPWILPPQAQTANQQLPETFQSVGSTGVVAMVSRLLLSIYPPDRPFFTLALPATIEYAQDIPEDVRGELTAAEYKQALKDVLWRIELAVQSILESANLIGRTNRMVMGFRNAKRASLANILVTGESLERINRDFSITVIRRDHYVTNRDSTGAVRYHIVREAVDVLALSDDTLEKAQLKRDEFVKLPADRRQKDLYTLCEWDPHAEHWVIIQEINDREILRSEEPRSPFLSTTFELTPPEHYGRGWIEMNIGELRSLNELEARALDHAGLCSKVLWVRDYNSSVKPDDLALPSGKSFKARVSAGQVQDVAALTVGKIQDFSVVAQMIERKGRALGRALGLETDATPRGDRVTAFQAARVGAEIEMTQGGPYAAIAEENQLPMLRYVLHEMQVQGLIPALPPETVEIRTLTGLSAIERNNQLQKILQLTDVFGRLGDAMLSKINLDVFAQVISRYGGVFEDGLIKSKKQQQEEQQAAMQQQAAMAATQKGIDVLGDAVKLSMPGPSQGAQAQ